MFDFAERNNGAIKIILGVIAVSFVLFGVENFSNVSGSNDTVASVGDLKVSSKELGMALQVNGLQENQAHIALEDLVKKYLLLNQGNEVGIAALESELIKKISENPMFQLDNKFSEQKYRDFLKNSGFTVAEYQNSVKQDIILDQIINPYFGSSFISNSILSRLNNDLQSGKEIQKFVIPASSFTNSISVSDQELNDFYQKNKNQLQLPDRVKAEYVVFALDSLTEKQVVSDAEASSYYESNKSRFDKEERNASHILIRLDAAATAESKTVAKNKIQELLNKVKNNPTEFPNLAKQFSEDPGSKETGGDLGFASKGTFVKPFEEALFKLKEGEISNIIETQFGFHIIQCKAIRKLGFNDAKLNIIDLIKRDKAKKVYAENLEKFKELAFQQPESLVPLVKEFGLTMAESDWSTKTKPASPDLGKAMEALFSPDVLQKRLNSDAIDLGSDRWMVVRVKSYEKAHLPTLEALKSEIVNKIKTQKAISLAEQAAKTKVSELKSGIQKNEQWEPAVKVTRLQGSGLSPDLIKQIFRQDAKGNPAYLYGKEGENGYVIVKVNLNLPADDSTKSKLAEELNNAYLFDESNEYFKSLNQQFEVKRFLRQEGSVQ